MSNPALLLTGAAPEPMTRQLGARFALHSLATAESSEAILAEVGPAVCAIACLGKIKVDATLMSRLPNLAVVANFGVGYDLIDAAHAGRNGVVVTNTPDVLNEEVADTTIGLLIATIREFGRAEQHLRMGKWPAGAYPLTASLRGRTVGVLGMGRIGQAIARRLEGFGLPVVYHSRNRQPDVAYRHYPDLVAMAHAVDTLIAIVPGGAATKDMINAEVLAALGPSGVLINVARGSVVDQPALIAALRDGVILAAGLDVFAAEPEVPPELIALPNAVLLPHVGSASAATRQAMGQLVVDNLLAYADGKPPLTPVVETPFSGWKT